MEAKLQVLRQPQGLPGAGAAADRAPTKLRPLPRPVKSEPRWPTSKAAAAAKSLQLCPTLCNPIESHPWDSPGKNTGVGCHFLLQCIKVKSESEVAQSCLTLSDPMDCSLPGSSIHAIFQARVLEWDAVAFSTASKDPQPKEKNGPLEILYMSEA